MTILFRRDPDLLLMYFMMFQRQVLLIVSCFTLIQKALKKQTSPLVRTENYWYNACHH